MALDRGKKKKITVIALVTILVVAAVVGTFIHSRKLSHSTKHNQVEIDTEMKTGILIAAGATVVTATTVIILCKYTDFREICRETLNRIRTGIREPRELIKGGFNAAVDRIQFAIEKSYAIRQTEKDTRAAMALDQCKELLTISIEDLKRSINKVNLFDIVTLDNTVEVRVWLSGAVTYQETCLDAFENTTGDSGMMMTKLLDIGNKLTRNCLAMIDGVIELSGGVPPKNRFPRFPQPKPETTVVDWKIDTPEVPQPKPKNVVVDWKIDQPEVPQPKPKTISIDWKVNRPEVPQPKPKTINVDWKVNRPEVPQPKPKNVIVDWKVDQPEVPQPKPKTVNVDWKVDQPEVPQSKPKTVNVDWKVDQPEVQQPKPKTINVDWKVDQPEVQQPKPKTINVDWKVNRPEVPQPKTKTVNVNWKVDRTEVVPQPKPKSVNVGWKTDVTISHKHSSTDDSKQIAGNRRMLDQMSNDDQEDPAFHSKLQMVGDASNEEVVLTPDSKPTNTPYPSWADSSRRSLINVDPKTVKPIAVVAQDGSGDFKTITEAVNKAPKRSPEPFIILIKAGTYNEYVMIPRNVDNVVFLGEGPTKTKITGNKNFIDGTATYHSATVAVNGDGFMAKDIGFENSAGPDKHQAVALRVSADMSVFHNCIMDGYQDTLYTHSYRQFYRQCVISGTIDFIFGNAAAVFQDCKMIVRKPMNNQACMVTAQGRKDQHSVGGLVLDGCTITADPEFMNTVPMPKSYLGRPWKEHSRTIIMQSFIDKNIDPEGWAPWTGTFGQDTCYYAEVNNKGPGADTSKRVTWKGIKKISQQEAQSYAPGIYIQGDTWIKASSVPYDSGLMKI